MSGLSWWYSSLSVVKMYTHQQCDHLKEMYYAESESTDDSQQVASHMHQSLMYSFKEKPLLV